jgi:hypothetical protein
MARLTKIRGRKPIEDEDATAGISNFREDGGLRFLIRVGDHSLSLSQLERDELIASWNKMQPDFER